MKKLFLFVSLLSILFLSSCDIFKQLKEELDQAIEYSKEFCELLKDEDYNNAVTYLHSEYEMDAEELCSYIQELERKNKVDFSDGIEYEKNISFSSTYYTSEYHGSAYEFTFKALIGNEKVEIYFTIIKNDNGYGIYSFGISS